MSRWIALLRGVNVNGITVRSAELAQLFHDLEFDAVRTVLASGNVCFETAPAHGAATEAGLKSRIEAGLSERFGYEAWVVLVEHAALSAIVHAYPFDEDTDHHAYIVFASDAPARDDVLSGAPEMDAASGEQLAAGADVVYWRCPKGASTETPFSKHLGRARFKATTTTRNLNTLRKLV